MIGSKHERTIHGMEPLAPESFHRKLKPVVPIPSRPLMDLLVTCAIITYRCKLLEGGKTGRKGSSLGFPLLTPGHCFCESDSITYLSFWRVRVKWKLQPPLC